MKKFFILIFAAAFITSCSNDTKKVNENTIKVAVIEPVTGDLAQYGQAIKEGIELGIEEINNAGGINGKNVEELFADTKGDIQETVNAFKKFASSGIDAVFGEAISPNSLAIAELAQRAKIPMITPTGTSLDITKDKDYIFRTTFTDPYQGKVIAKYIGDLGAKKVGLMVNASSDYSIGIAEAFKEYAINLGMEVIEERYTNNDKDFKTILTKMKNENISDIMIPDYYNNIGLILMQAQEIGLESNYYGADGWEGVQNDFAELAEGAVFTSQFNINSDDEITQEFAKKYEKKYSKEANVFAALGYDTIMILKKAIESGKEIKDAIKEIDDNFVTGAMKFDENGNPEKEVKLLQIKDGKLVLKEQIADK